jgi:hypothetical protein
LFLSDAAWLVDDQFNLDLNGHVEQVLRSSPQLPRDHVGASVIGAECDRAIQYSRYCVTELPARVRLLFNRGHSFEKLIIERLKFCGFQFAAPELLRFALFDGAFGGTADGVIVAAPAIRGLMTPSILEIKALNGKNFNALSRNGLARAFPKYWTQVCVYQRCLGFTNPALFVAVNSDSCETVYFLSHFNADLAEAAIQRAKRIVEANRRGELLPRAFDRPDDWRCAICPHKQRCWGDQIKRETRP